MKLTRSESVCGGMRRMGSWIALAVVTMLSAVASAQAVSTTTVQGTVYLANGQPGGGTLVVSWPSFTTAAGQAIAADQLTVTIAADGFVSVNLAPNQGATPAGEYYTATYYMSDGSTNTEYWVVPAAAQATIGQVRAQVMPAEQAVQAVSKAYVDQSIAELQQSLLSASGGNLSGPLYLSGDPTQPLQAADKHYVDAQVATAVPLSGGTMTGALTLSADPTQAMQAADKEYVDAGIANAWPALVLRADEFAGSDFGAKLQACVNALSASYGGTCDARNFTGNQTMSAGIAISTANTTILLPCASISTANQIVVTAGTRNVALRGCALRGGSAASGSQGGTALAYSGASALIEVGDPTYATDTSGFHLDNVVINTTAATSAAAHGLTAYRTQEMGVESVYFLGNANQTGMTLDGTGNYTGGTFLDNQFDGFQIAVNAIGHQVANAATTDWMNASSFVRLHIDCPTSNGNPIAGTYGIDLQQGDGNTFTGGDVEGCATALHLGANAQNNTIVGLRNENSTNQVVADAGSSYNNWISGGTMFTGQLRDNGTRNSFQDTFHRSFNGLNGDWYGSQQDMTLTNHFRLGIGSGSERGLLNRYQTDYGYRWTMGLSDATGGEQFYQVLDELNNVYRLSVGQYNNGQSNTNNQTAINSAGTGAVVLNGSNNAGTGGLVVGSGGASATTVATISNAGNAQFTGNLQVGGTAQFTGTPTVRNNADAEVDYYLWPGLTTSQKGSFTYKDWNGNSQWYMLKDASNNWALNSAVGGLDSFKAYQSTNSGDTYVNASNSSGAVRVNYESGSGSAFKVYGGNSSTLYASFTGTTSIEFPGLAAASGQYCLQVDTSGYVTNTGAACGSGMSGTVNSSNTGYIAYYTASGTAIGGMSSVPVTAGGTGATSSSVALANLGGVPVTGGTVTGALNSSYSGANSFAGTVAVGTPPPTGAPSGTSAAAVLYSPNGFLNVKAFGATGSGTVNDAPAIQNAVTTACTEQDPKLYFPNGTYLIYPTSTCSEAVTISCSLDIEGESKEGTIFSYMTLNDANPTSNYSVISSGNPICSGGYGPIAAPAVWRGGPFRIVGGSSSATAISSTFRHLTIKGNATPTYNYNPLPASTSTGDGWDLTNNGIFYELSTYFNNITLDDVDIGAVRGQPVYDLTQNLGMVKITHSAFHDSNPDGISSSGNQQIIDDDFYDLGLDAFEDTINTGAILLSGNHVHNTYSGFAFAGVTSGTGDPTTPALVVGNKMWDVTADGVTCIFCHGLIVTDNTFTDVAQWTSGTEGSRAVISLANQSTGHPGIKVENVQITSNAIQADNYQVDTGISAVADDGAGGPYQNPSGDTIKIEGNTIGPTPNATRRGLIVATPWSQVGTITNLQKFNNIINNVKDSGGFVSYSGSQTASAQDNGNLVEMYCTSACSYTLPNPWPSPTWQISLVSQGPVTATVTLASGATYNSQFTAPSLANGQVLFMVAQSNSTANYTGYVPLAAGNGVSLSLANNALTIATNTRSGSWAISSSQTTSVTFSSALPASPSSCSLTPSASAASTGTPFATNLSSTGFTVNVPTSGSLSGTYTCVVSN